jgi:hypothetical protein
MVSFLSFLWFFCTFKAVLFYVYLWQLKEYHIGRFFAHFATAKGRDLIFNPLNIFKVILLPLFLRLPLLVFFLIIFLYLFEFFKFSLDIILRKVKRPVFTKKAAILVLSAAILQAVFLFLIFKNLLYF